MPAKKKSNTSIDTVKKTSRKKPAETKEMSPKKATTEKSNHTPIYIIIIMVLSIILVIMIGKQFTENKKTEQKINIPVKTNTPAVTNITKENQVQNTDSDTDENGNEQSQNEKENPEVTANVYFIQLDKSSGKIKYISVKKSIPGKTPVSESLGELIKGPSGSKGYESAIPEGLKIKSIQIIDNIATIDFNEAFTFNAVGDILTARINQIYYTATDNDEVKGIIIKINGKTATTIGGDGRVFHWPLKKGL